MHNSAHVAFLHIATSTGERKYSFAPTQPVSKTPSPRAGPFINAEIKPVFNAFARHATHHAPSLTGISGQLTKKPSHPSLKLPPTPPNIALAPLSPLMHKNYLTSCHPPVTINHSLTPSKTSPPRGLNNSHSTSPSRKKMHIFSHNLGGCHKSSQPQSWTGPPLG